MSSLGAMVTEIRSEIRRSGMDDAIKGGICAAVQFYRDKRFAWNELNFSFVTVADQQTYDEDDNAYIGQLASIDSLRIRDPETPLEPRNINWVKDRVGQVSGTPQNYAYYGKQIWLDPTPSDVFTLDLLGIRDLADTSQAAGLQIMTRDNIATLPSNYSTAWFDDGYDMIKTWAKGYINLHHLRNTEQSTTMFDAAGGLSNDQEAKINRLGGSGFVTPTRF